jgi:hypothetical protein
MRLISKIKCLRYLSLLPKLMPPIVSNQSRQWSGVGFNAMQSPILQHKHTRTQFNTNICLTYELLAESFLESRKMQKPSFNYNNVLVLIVPRSYFYFLFHHYFSTFYPCLLRLFETPTSGLLEGTFWKLWHNFDFPCSWDIAITIKEKFHMVNPLSKLVKGVDEEGL